MIAYIWIWAGFAMVVIAAGLAAMPRDVLEAARTDGASEWQTFRRVTVPLALPALLGGAVLTWARALGEFGATITFAGSLQGVTRTLPLEIYLQRETNPDAAVALSFVLVAVAVVVIGLARGSRELR